MFLVGVVLTLRLGEEEETNLEPLDVFILNEGRLFLCICLNTFESLNQSWELDTIRG